MPRGIPNARRDDTGMRYTSFQVPVFHNPKHVQSSYLKADSQTLWARNAARSERVSEGVDQDLRRGSNVLVIHPGSRFLRVGLACDLLPVSVPCVVARRHKKPVPEATYIERILRPRKRTFHPEVSDGSAMDFPEDSFESKIAGITASLRDRMHFYKLHIPPNAAKIASTFNESSQPEVLQDPNAGFNIDWIRNASSSGRDVYVGEEALRLADPMKEGYIVRWPIYGKTFNIRDYPSLQAVLGDLETLLLSTLKGYLNIPPEHYQFLSVVLVIPDFYERAFVREFTHLLLVTMGFSQICVQQESLAATYGAGISNACVVDVGATTTSIACVDEGMVIADSRMVLNMGGDDITEFLHLLLERIHFPYRDANLARWYDWNVMEVVKAHICTLAEGDVADNRYDIDVSRPDKPAAKYAFSVYDEVILAPMCLFEPKIIDFDRKRIGMRLSNNPYVSEEIFEQGADQPTQAMRISTRHLVQPPQILEMPPLPRGISEPLPPLPPHARSQSIIPDIEGPAPPLIRNSEAEPQPLESTDMAVDIENENGPGATDSINEEGSSSRQTAPPEPVPPIDQATSFEGSPIPNPAQAPGPATLPAQDLPPDITPSVELPAPLGLPIIPEQGPPPLPMALPPPPIEPQMPLYNNFAIDIPFEASKLPLDVAIFNATRASGGDDKIRKYLSAVLLVGGTALIPGAANALESRLQAIATPLVANMEQVQIIPPPKEVDPRILVWKGAAVLGKMDGVSELWVTRADWDILGMRGLRERCFYL